MESYLGWTRRSITLVRIQGLVIWNWKNSKYTGDGNTDFKVYIADGTVRFYRLYYMEAP